MFVLATERFTTPLGKVVPNAFEGDVMVFSARVAIPGTPADLALHAFIRFRSVTTDETEIDIGGLDVGFGAEAGVIGLEGIFKVADKGTRSGSTPWLRGI